MVLSDNTALYFFSALLQTDAAVVAVIAVVVVFKLQSLQAITSNLRSFMMEKIGRREREVLIRFDQALLEDKKKIASENTEGLLAFLSHELPYHEEIDVLKREFVFPSGFLAVLIILNIVGLILANTLHQDFPYWEVKLIFANGSLHIFGFIFVIYKVNRILRRSSASLKSAKK